MDMWEHFPNLWILFHIRELNYYDNDYVKMTSVDAAFFYEMGCQNIL